MKYVDWGGLGTGKRASRQVDAEEYCPDGSDCIVPYVETDPDQVVNI